MDVLAQMTYRKVIPTPTPLCRQPAIVTMTQTAILIFGEDVAWMLLQVTGITVLYFAVRKFMDEYRLSLSRLKGPFRKQTVSLYELVIPVFRLFD